MNNKQFQSFLHKIGSLNYSQLKQLRHSTDTQISSNIVGQAISDREEAISVCPHCDSRKLNRWGMTKQGIQRFRCKSCSKTFNALSGTPLYRMRHPEKWAKYTELMWNGVSLRAAAKELDINLRTSFRWRHVFLKKPNSPECERLIGIIEADETFIPESFKGRKVTSRKPRKRGGGNTDKVPVLMALDRAGDISHKVLERDTQSELKAVLKPIIAPGSVLCTDGNLSYKGIAKDLGVDHKRLIAMDKKRVIDGIYHIQTLNNYMMRWKSWLVRFHGVGTGYLENYLSWFRFMEQHVPHQEKDWIKAAL
ncbi:MAG: IS1595 family transposase [Pseudomonadales bacterium]|nr:IS1595 family transposase [Pseudomonadales bacterium]